MKNLRKKTGCLVMAVLLLIMTFVPAMSVTVSAAANIEGSLMSRSPGAIYGIYVPELHSLEIQTGRSVLFPDPYICGLPIFLYTAENTESSRWRSIFSVPCFRSIRIMSEQGIVKKRKSEASGNVGGYESTFQKCRNSDQSRRDIMYENAGCTMIIWDTACWPNAANVDAGIRRRYRDMFQSRNGSSIII